MMTNELPSSSSSSSLLSATTSTTPDHQTPSLLQQRQQQRQLEKVNRINDETCNLTQYLRTSYNGHDTATGIMFTVRAVPSSSLSSSEGGGGSGKNTNDNEPPLHVLTMEFQINQESGIGPGDTVAVKVFGRPEGFSGHIDNESEWTMLADTDAYVTSNGNGAIIPSQQFESVTIPAGETYAFYVSTIQHSAMLKLSPVDTFIGEVSAGGIQQQNDGDDGDNGDNPSLSSLSSLLEIHTGVTLTDSGLFPSSFDQAANFNGMIHYRSTQSCEESRTETDVTFEFAVNDDPTEDIMNAITNAVQSSLQAILTLTPPLSTYRSQYLVDMIDVKTSFQGRSTQKCPTDFGKCSLLSSTVTLAHFETLPSGTLQVAVLSEHTQLMDAISSQDIGTGVAYVAEPLLSGMFIFSLDGVPATGADETLTESQRLYFERVTSMFLHDKSDGSIYFVTIKEISSERRHLLSSSSSTTTNISLSSKHKTDIPHMHRRYLRGSTSDIVSNSNDSRVLQPSGVGNNIELMTEVIGYGSESLLRSNVVEGIGSNEDEYINELITRQFRPAEITPPTAGAFFTGINGAFARMGSSSFGGTGGGATGKGNGSSGGGVNAAVVVLALGLVGSLFYLFWRVYRDFFVKPDENAKILDEAKSSNTILSRLQFWKKDDIEYHDDIISVGHRETSENTPSDSVSESKSSDDDQPSDPDKRIKVGSTSLHDGRSRSTSDLKDFGSTDHPKMYQATSTQSLDIYPRPRPNIDDCHDFAKYDDDHVGGRSVASEDTEIRSHAESVREQMKKTNDAMRNSSRSLESVESEIAAGEWDSSSESSCDDEVSITKERLFQSESSIESEESQMERDEEVPLSDSDESDLSKPNREIPSMNRQRPIVARKKSTRSLPELQGLRSSINSKREQPRPIPKKVASGTRSVGGEVPVPRNQSGKNGRGLTKSKSLTEIVRPTIMQKYSIDDFSSSSEESDFDEQEETIVANGQAAKTKKTNKKMKMKSKTKAKKKEKQSSSSKKAKSSAKEEKSKKKKSEKGKESGVDEMASTDDKTSTTGKKVSLANQSGLRGRGVTASKSLPIQKSATVVLSDDSSDVSSITMSVHPKKTRIPKAPTKSTAPTMDLTAAVFRPPHMRDCTDHAAEQNRPTVKRSHSAEHVYGKCGKIHYEPKQHVTTASATPGAAAAITTTKKPASLSGPDLSLRLVGQKALQQYHNKSKNSASTSFTMRMAANLNAASMTTSSENHQSSFQVTDTTSKRIMLQRSASAERRQLVKDHLGDLE